MDNGIKLAMGGAAATTIFMAFVILNSIGPSDSISFDKEGNGVTITKPSEGNIHIEVDDRKGSKKKFNCDYSAWGSCGVDNTTGLVICDSKYDGNADGVCQSGESCVFLNPTKDEIKQEARLYKDLQQDKFSVRCNKL